MDEVILGEKRYISSKRAAEITGYAKDYVGQLCREGYVEAKMVGRSWYVLEASIREHRFGPQAARVGEQDVTEIENEAKEGFVEVLEEVAEAPYEPHTASDTSPARENEPLATWERPVYRAEVPQTMPQMAPRPTESAQAAISDMQAAWKEWFEQRRDAQTAPEASETTNEIIEDTDEGFAEEAVEEAVEGDESDIYEAQEDESAFEVPIHRQKEPEIEEIEEDEAEEGEIRIPVHKIMSPAPAAAVAYPTAAHGIIREERIVSPQRRSQGRSAAVVAAPQRSSFILRVLFVAIAVVVVSAAYVGSGKLADYDSNPLVRFLGGTSTIQK